MKIEKPDWLQQTEGILETLNEGVLIVDDCQQFIFANQRMGEMTGFAREEVLGRGPSAFYSGEALDFLNRMILQTTTTGQNRYEFFVPRKDGTRVPAIFSARVVEDLDGREFIIITFTDITEQKRAEDQLRAANQLLAARQEEIDRDLALAARVQQSLAPQSLTWGPFHVEALYQPVSTIGGDFGVVTPSGEELHLLVCDVSGHGITSALIANRIYTETMSMLSRCEKAPEILRRLNHFVLHEIRMPGFYFSMAMARLSADRRRMCFLNAGHPPAIWVCRSGETRFLEARSTVLGLLDEAVGADPAEDIDLQSGDRVLLYTDGISEAFNGQDELLGHEGLAEIARKASGKSLADMKERILADVAAWRHGPVTDDMSMVLIEVK